MASRYHWVQNSLSTTGALPTTFFHLHCAIPAGGVLKRFMLRRALVLGVQKTNFPEYLYPLYMDQSVYFSSGVNVGRIIYTSGKRVPFVVMFDVTDLINPYKAWYQAGDHELGFNQRCSYGQSTDPSYDLEFTGFLQSPFGAPAGVGGSLDITLAALYYL